MVSLTAPRSRKFESSLGHLFAAIYFRTAPDVIHATLIYYVPPTCVHLLSACSPFTLTTQPTLAISKDEEDTLRDIFRVNGPYPRIREY